MHLESIPHSPHLTHNGLVLAFLCFAIVSCLLRLIIQKGFQSPAKPMRMSMRVIKWTLVISSAMLLLVSYWVHPLLLIAVVMGGIVGGGLSNT